jgi:hypothetical protein
VKTILSARLSAPTTGEDSRHIAAGAQDLTQFLLHNLGWRHRAARIHDEYLIHTSREGRRADGRCESNSQIGKSGHGCIPFDGFLKRTSFIRQFLCQTANLAVGLQAAGASTLAALKLPARCDNLSPAHGHNVCIATD